MKFNKTKKPIVTHVNHPDLKTNLAGGLAYKVTPEQELVRRVCAGFLGEPKFYEPSGKKQMEAIEQLSKLVSRRFLLQLANFARTRMKMRSAPMLLLLLAAEHGEAPRSDVREYAQKIIQRADEPAELIAGWLDRKGSKQKLPSALKRGIADSLEKFDEYSLKKNDSNKASVKLKDVIKIVHPRPKTSERSDLYKRALEGTLKTPETWETKLSAAGQEGKEKNEAWDEIAPKMGLMALIRNLRNMEQAGAEKALEIAYKRLQDPKEVEKSKLLPFRFLAADRNVTRQPTRNALRKAVNLSVANIPSWGGKTAVFADCSGSMMSAISQKSLMSCRDIASMMAAITLKLSDDGVVGVFADRCKILDLSSEDSILTNANIVGQNHGIGYGTNTSDCIQHLIKTKSVMDRVIILSDMQTYSDNYWGGLPLPPVWKEYKRIAPGAQLITINLNGYGDAMMPEDDSDVMMLTGWSEGIFEFITLMQRGASIVDEIVNKW